MTSIRLQKTHPISGRRNSYRERWALVNGRVFHVSADSLYGVWTVEDDDEHLSPREALAFIESDEHRMALAFTLAEAREIIARWTA